MNKGEGKRKGTTRKQAKTTKKRSEPLTILLHRIVRVTLIHHLVILLNQPQHVCELICHTLSSNYLNTALLQSAEMAYSSTLSTADAIHSISLAAPMLIDLPNETIYFMKYVLLAQGYQSQYCGE